MKNNHHFTIIILLGSMCAFPAFAQYPYVLPQYDVREEKDIVYGTATNFAGGVDTLKLDLYKPVGDNNCRRPLLVMVHGGAWIGGSKNDYDVVAICKEMASRGYAAASVSYRLGMHPLNFYQPYAFCNDNLNPFGINKCIYMADTVEIIRALYRGMQDAKGAVRFLKGRHETDSTDIENVFIGGSSAGAFISLSVGLMDMPTERPTFTFEQAEAPVPDSDLASCVPAPKLRTRPDLGDIEGSLHLGNYDANVRGVAAFMGGVFQENLIAGPDTPAVYLYHRTDDLVVSCRRQPLLPLYPWCINQVNLCQPHYNRPWSNGSCAIADFLENMGTASPPFYNDIPDYGTEGTDDCLDNPPGHSIENIPLRCTNLSGFFAPLIAATGNVPGGNCTSGISDKTASRQTFFIYPNPVQYGVINITSKGPVTGSFRFRLLDFTGRSLAQAEAAALPFAWNPAGVALPSGVYFVEISGGGQRWVVKVVF